MAMLRVEPGVGDTATQGRGLARPEASGRMLDRCPFHRILSDKFHGCPAFQPAEFITVDLQFRATRPTWTCRYLEVGTAAPGEYSPPAPWATAHNGRAGRNASK